MSRPRIAVGGFQHETNTFTPMPTTYEDFALGGAWPALVEGDALFETVAPVNIPIAGFIDAAQDCELVPLLWTAAEPSGYVTDDAFDRITGRMTEMIRAAGPLDAVYLDLHGAMVTESHVCGEAETLARVREVIGPDLPLAVSLDLHGNMSPAFFAHASCVTIYRTYPHIDMADTGARAQALLARLLDCGQPFARAYRQLDYIIPITAQSTMREPGRQLYAMLPDLEGNGVDSVDFCFGFPPADIPDNGCTVFAYGTDQAAVDRAADTMLTALQDAEPDFVNPLVPAPEAVAHAMDRAERAVKPVVICDPQDNPGAGGVGDSTGLLRAMIDGGVQGAALSMLWDPAAAEAAHAAGEGAELDLALGGQYPEVGGTPVEARVRVEQIHDGVFTFSGPMYGGATARLGPCARLRILGTAADLQVIVGSIRCQNADQEMFRAIGFEPRTASILAVKSAVHFLGDYEPIAEEVVFAEAPGANPCNMTALPFTRLRAGVRLGPLGPVHPG